MKKIRALRVLRGLIPMIDFLRSNILKKISSKISSVATKKIRVLRALRGSFRVPSVDYSEWFPWDIII